MFPRSVDVLIAGAGISGLAAAHWLKKRGRSVLVVEKDREPGGTMKSVRRKGFLYETGPNSALETTPLFKELVADLGLESEMVYADPVGKNRFILRDGRLMALPMGPGAFIRTPLFSWKAKFRLMAEPFIGRAEKEESIAEFVTRRIGSEFLDYAIDPFVAGVYAAQPDQLSVRAAFPKLYALEEKYGGLIRGMIGGARERKKREEKAKDRAESFSFLSGMQTLPNALAARLGTSFVTGAVLRSVSPTRTGFRATVLSGGKRLGISARSVIIAMPAHAAADVVRPLSVETAEALASIHYPPVASIFAGYRTGDVRQPLDGFGLLIPTKERRKILGVLWSSSLFPRRAPKGMSGFTLFAGGGRQPEVLELSDKRLAELALKEMASIMQIQGKPVYWHVERWPKAIPQYTVGYSSTLDRLEKFEEANPGLVFCSNFVGGISVGDCVLSARRTAERIDDLLGSEKRLPTNLPESSRM
ncbi:MAG TPA: protoporphyrinogen oxidase [Bacteroidetes bacterium]|nr:protoporphyrinogen oxidase [Bacteroidota bacterium]